jgi:hypothetical protein
MALVLSALNPERQDAILQAGYEWGQSRVIAGYHWQSDVDAGRMTGSLLYQLIRNHERFIGQLARARAEFKEKTGTTQVSEAPTVQQPSAPARVYRLDGTPADETSSGIFIQNNQKFVRKR